MEPARAQRREAVGPRTAAHLLTERLRLDAVVPDDLDEHFALMSDHGVGVLAGNVWDAFAGREVRPARRRSWLIFLGVAVAAYVTATAIGRYPDPDAVRLVHADRPLPDDILAGSPLSRERSCCHMRPTAHVPNWWSSCHEDPGNTHRSR